MRHQLFAYGKRQLPQTITIRQREYHLEQVLKHDFFAATALYQSTAPCDSKDTPNRIIFKSGCRQFFLGFPMSLIGRPLVKREVRNLKHLSDIGNTPRLLSEFDKLSFTYEYIDGVTLADAQNIPEDFFDKLHALVKDIHKTGFVYLDMNKTTNIIVGDDSQPYLIDFQISMLFKNKKRSFSPISNRIRDRLQREDLYHLCKHKRRFGYTLTDDEKNIARPSLLIRLHRCIATPYRKIRRALLKRICQ